MDQYTYKWAKHDIAILRVEVKAMIEGLKRFDERLDTMEAMLDEKKAEVIQSDEHKLLQDELDQLRISQTILYQINPSELTLDEKKKLEFDIFRNGNRQLQIHDALKVVKVLF